METIKDSLTQDHSRYSTTCVPHWTRKMGEGSTLDQSGEGLRESQLSAATYSRTGYT